MSRDDNLLAEYNRICAELHENFRQNQQTVGLVVAAVGVIIAGALQSSFTPKYPLYVAATAVTWGGYIWLFDSLQQLWRHATYLRVFLEPELPGINWETRLRLRYRVPGQEESIEGTIVPTVFMLHATNAALAFLMLLDRDWGPRLVAFVRSLLNSSGQHTSGLQIVSTLSFTFLLQDACIALPLLLVYYYNQRARSACRGGDLETQQCRSWICLKRLEKTQGLNTLMRDLEPERPKHWTYRP